MNMPRIGVHSPWALDDPRSWSGVVAPMVREIGRHGSLVPLRSQDVGDALIDRLRARLSRRPVLPAHSLATARRRSRALRDVVADSPVDLVVSIAGSTALTLPLHVPVLQITDATFDAVADFYPQFSGLSRGSLRQGAAVERRAAAHTGRYIVTSDWARRSLIGDVSVPSQCIAVAPFGPAILPPHDVGAARPLSARGVEDPLELLFVASDWHRKNGPAALEIHAAVRERTGARLTVVGDAPDLSGRDGVRGLGRLDPDALSRLYRSSDVLLEPSRANASGVTITDALHHGLPVLATEVGGVPDLVHAGVGGWLVRPDSVVEESAALLAGLSRERVQEMSRTARADAQERLTWQAWGRAFAASVAARSPAAGGSGTAGSGQSR